MTDYAGFKHGAATFPLQASTTNSLLRDADPALFYLLDYVAGILDIHLGARFAAQALAASRADLTEIVAMSVPYDPSPWLTEGQFQFPLLAVYRVSERYEGRTVGKRHNVCEMRVELILPPLDAAQAEQLLPILSAVPRVIDHRIHQGFDPAYTPPDGAPGDHVWSASFAKLEDVMLTSGTFARYEDGQSLMFPTWSGTLQVKEQAATYVEEFVALSGVDHETKLVNPGETTVDDFVDFKSDVVLPGPSTAGS